MTVTVSGLSFKGGKCHNVNWEEMRMGVCVDGQPISTTDDRRDDL